MSQDAPRVEVFRREDDVWARREAEAGGLVELATLGVTLAVDALYENPLARA